MAAPTMAAPAPTSLIPPPLPMSQLHEASVEVEAPAPPAPPKTKPKRRGRRGGRGGERSAPELQPVDPALLAAYREFSEDVRPSDHAGVYFPEHRSAEQAEEPKKRERRNVDFMPGGRGRTPSTGKGPVVLAGVAAVALGTVFAVVLAGRHGTTPPAPALSHAVHVDATAANASTSITVPTTATRGPAYTLTVPAGFVADAGSDGGSDVLLSEPVLDLHLRVQSRTKDAALKIPSGSPATMTIAGATAKGTEATARGHAVRTVQFARDGITYTVTETVPAGGKEHTFKVLDQVLSGWSFSR
ncbi:MAG TPA: hypothetical protein VHE83_12510 [Mycobacteriales bacterium]|nr:hypothetical protein [Mycobacteriales bacterium]